MTRSCGPSGRGWVSLFDHRHQRVAAREALHGYHPSLRVRQQGHGEQSHRLWRPETASARRSADGPSDREEIETLLSLDSLGQLDDDWPGYLVATVKAFVLSTSDPPGSVDADTAAWLVITLSDARPRSAAAIIRAVLSEARHVDEVLLTFGKRGATRPAVSEAAT